MSGPVGQKSDKTAAARQGQAARERPRPAPQRAQDGILALQQAAGNQAVGEALGQGAGRLTQAPGSLIQRQPASEEGVCPVCGRRGRGQCPDCGQDFVPLQRSANSPGPAPSSGLDAVRGALGSSGQPLGPTVRSFMESRFGTDFGGVRVHTDGLAAESARAVNAHAYTVGRDVVFGQGQYNPNTESGRSLLAHELAHVVQQRGRPVDLQALSIDDGGDSVYEREAARAASAVNAPGTGRAPITVGQTLRSPAVQRRRVNEPAGGCGLCHGPQIAGQIAHTLIQTEFEIDNPLGLSELEIRQLGSSPTDIDNGRLDLTTALPRGLAIGEIKPANDGGYLRGAEDMQFYLDAARARYPQRTITRLRIRIGPEIGIFPNPQVPACPPQTLYVNMPVGGVFGYYCDPPFSRLVRDPNCKCERRRRRRQRDQPQAVQEESEEETTQDEARPEAEPRGIHPTDIIPVATIVGAAYLLHRQRRAQRLALQAAERQAQRATRRAAQRSAERRLRHAAERRIARQAARQAERQLARQTRRAVERGVERGVRRGTQRAIRRGATRAAGRAAAGLGGRAVARFIPYVGLILLISDVAEAAVKISQGAHFGGEGFEDLPEGAQAVEGEGWITPDITEEELAEFAAKDVPPEIIEALQGDLVLQQFLWDVAKLRLEKQGRPLTAEELRELSGVLQNADPEAVQRILPYLRSTSGDTNLTEAMERALAISPERLPPPPTAEERRRPAQPTPGPEAEAQAGEGGGGSRTGEAGAGGAPGETGLPRERLKELDAYPNLKEFFNTVLAPTSQRTGTEVTPEFLDFLLANAERLNNPEVLARIRRTISEGEQSMASLQQAIQSLLQGERDRPAGEGEGQGTVAAGRAGEGRGRARAGEGEGEGEPGRRTRRRRGQGGEGTGTRGQRGGQRGEGAGEGRRRRRGETGLRSVTGPPQRRRIEPLAEIPASATITRGFQLLRGLSKGRAYEAGDVAEIAIRIEAAGGRHEITVPIVIDSRTVSGEIVSLTAHVKGTDDAGNAIQGWGITGTDVVIPANADVTYEWRPRARRGRGRRR